MSRSPGRLFLALPVTLCLVGCMRWEALPISPSEVLEQEEGQVRITRTGGEEVVLFEFMLSGDSVYGTATRGRRPPCRRDQLGACEVAMPLSDVRYVDVRRLDEWRTAAIVLVPVGAVALIAIEELACSPSPFPEPEPSC